MKKQMEKKIKYFTNNDLESHFEEKSYNERKKSIIDKLKKYNVNDIFSNNGKPKSFNLKEKIEQLMEQRNDLGMVANYYCTFYKVANLGIHSSPDNLNRYWIFDYNAGGIKDFHRGQRAEKCEINCIIASIHFMIMIMECLFTYFKYPKKEDVYQFWEITKKLGSKYKYFENIE
jgi:CRISPR/Cas system-associated protein Cas5 (RAMP superfamily)